MGLPMLWLCGPPGVGKSTVAWELFRERPGAGHVDLDQLGMCYPEIPADPGRRILQARALAAVAPNFAAAGATSLIVSGLLETPIAAPGLTVLRLRCERSMLRRRLDRRGTPDEAALAMADRLDRAGLPYPCLETTDRDVAAVLATVRDRWPEHPPRRPSPWPPAASTPGEIVLLCGPPAVGKSTVGWELSQLARSDGHVAGLIDLQQVGFLGDRSDDRLRTANVAALWSLFHAWGARRLVVNGPLTDPRPYLDALPTANVTVVRLDASPGTLRERIRLRGLGQGPLIAGDELRGQHSTVLAAAHEAAVAQAAALNRSGTGRRLATDGRPAAGIARQIADDLGW